MIKHPYECVVPNLLVIRAMEAVSGVGTVGVLTIDLVVTNVHHFVPWAIGSYVLITNDCDTTIVMVIDAVAFMQGLAGPYRLYQWW